MSGVPTELREKAEQVKAGKRTSAKVRTLLEWFGAQRRRQSVVAVIREALAEAKLRTEPDFEEAFIDGRVSFVSTPEATAAEPLKFSRGGAGAGAASNAATLDPTSRIGRLAAANRPPISVKPDDPVERAVTLMMHHDYSQLPIMTGPRDVKGMISWRSLGQRLARGKTAQRVLEAAESHYELGADTSLFEAIPVIIQRDSVLIRDQSKSICGIVTAADLCDQFQQLTEPFLLLNEIEEHIRSIIADHFSVSELATARDPAASARPVNRVADLTLGEYLRLLEQPQNWDRLGLGVSRQVVTDALRYMLDIRNDVMHFDPDGIPDEDVAALRRFVSFLQRLRPIPSL